jgi:recombination protein RecA
MSTALAEAIARLDARWGSRTVATATAADDRARGRRFLTGTSFDVISGGIRAGSAVLLAGEGTSGKVTLAHHAVAGAQREGGTALWIDPACSFDPVAAQRAGVDVHRAIVARPRSRDEVVLAAGAGLRSDGFRLVVVDLGPSFAAVATPDGLAGVLPYARGSTSALLLLADELPYRLAVPTFVFDRVAWESRGGRTLGWTFAVRRLGATGDERAVLAEAV